MLTRSFQSIRLSALGMGNMRLPSTNPADPNARIDHPAAQQLIRRAYDAGVNYFDTAWVYNEGDSEVCLGEALSGVPRNTYYLATKYFVGAGVDYKTVFETQLKHLQTDHIDFYLIHCLTDTNIDTYLTNGSIEYFLQQKKLGRISYLGFSSHSSVDTLRRFAAHHDWDFAQLQLNYFDWQFGTAKDEYQVLRDRNIPIIVMEPVRGGRLSALTPQAEQLLNSAHPEWSISSWGMRFVNSLPGVLLVLSGMTTQAQLDDNLATFSDGITLTEAEQQLCLQAGKLFRRQVQVPCTACRYCCATCPLTINIPGYLSLYNLYKTDGAWAAMEAPAVESQGKPADCIACGACTEHCPQHIDIPKAMAELAGVLAGNPA